MTDADPSRPGLEDSLVVMDIADRMRRRADTLDRASDYESRRQALRERLEGLYAAQHIDIDTATLDAAIEQHLARRLTHRPARGLAAALARLYVRWLAPRQDRPAVER
ncbi:DUF6384 family protein [Salinisphaera sp. Q1T1-3]|uniref:DUF6384 family protein n=1 Tax=Salinisphaera sp. Q1T1-3 TaxID=2321229 RepID=UPI000E73460D|nr:DUF6384 family protein [Salinisphaera sp. Q1T1-3]RJS94151.1 hypothetical protein D3260_06210 [Salinisphaera sp. Q1T1-3]